MCLSSLIFFKATAEVTFRAELVTTLALVLAQERPWEGDSEKVAIRDYLNKALTYTEILAFLDKYHGAGMRISTLKRLRKNTV